jgi:hypothetical protein
MQEKQTVRVPYLIACFERMQSVFNAKCGRLVLAVHHRTYMCGSARFTYNCLPVPASLPKGEFLKKARMNAND